MHLVIAEELLVEILQPNKAELQSVGPKPHAAQREDDGIEGRKYREYQNKDDRWRNEKSAGMAVKPFTPGFGVCLIRRSHAVLSTIFRFRASGLHSLPRAMGR